MNITGICPYETPCGWCTKWDKKCDKKIGYDASSKEKYGNIFNPCYDCARRGPRSSPECKECHASNGFKHFKVKEKKLI